MMWMDSSALPGTVDAFGITILRLKNDYWHDSLRFLTKGKHSSSIAMDLVDKNLIQKKGRGDIGKALV
jgi:hypothetical protein